jgi:adenine-specific DNA-methyltransferase
LRQVIEGQDEGGATKEVSWQGGGGFRFFSLAPSLLESDRWGNWIVSRDYNAAMLAEAVCKLEGFSYSPDSETFWIHGRSTERDFIYVTTQNLSRAQLQFISEEVGDDRTLLICCGSFRVKRDAFSNLTLKKIPQAVLHRCEWGRDDYSLNVEALPAAEDAGENSEARPAQAKSRTKAARGNRKKKDRRGMHQLPLFDGKKQAEGGE